MTKVNNYEQCSIEVGRALGQELTQEQRTEIGNRVADLLEKYGQPDVNGDMTANVLKAVKALSDEVKRAALLEKRNRALNENFKLKIKDNLLNIWKDNPAEGIKALFGNSLADRQGSKNGIAPHVSNSRYRYMSGAGSALAEKNLLPIVTDPAFDRDLFLAKAYIDKPNELKKFAPEVVESAKIYKQYQDLAMRDYNRLGGDIRPLDGYVSSRSHDMYKLQKAAGPDIPITSEKHFQAWRDFVSERLDWEKTMPDLPPSKREKALNRIYQQRAHGYHVTFGEGASSGFKAIGGIGKSFSYERVMHFKTPELEYEYHTKFAQGSTVHENIMNGLERMGRDIGIMEKAGPNAEANITAAVEQVKQVLTDESLKDPIHAIKAKEAEKELEKQLKTLWPLITGKGSIPVNATLASYSQILRNIQQMRDLGGVVISATNDPVYYGATVRYYGERNFSSFLKGMGEGFSNVLGNIGKKVTPEEMKLASEAGILLDVLQIPATRSPGELDIAGRTSKWTQKMFKWNMYTWWQDRQRLGAVLGSMHRYAQHAELAFHELPEGMQAALRQFDISPPEWDTMRKSALHIAEDGREFLNPGNIPDKKLQQKYSVFLSEFAAMATNESALVEKAMMVGQNQPGTVWGEVRRHFFMYKGFTVNMMRRTMGREIHGYSAEKLSTPQRLMAMAKDPKVATSGILGLAGLMLFGDLLGYGTLVLDDLRKGKVPRVPTDLPSLLKIMGQAQAKSGSQGIYGDFLFGEMKSRFGHGPLETFLGPTYRTFADATDLFLTLRAKVAHEAGISDKDVDLAAKAFNFALNHVPPVSMGYNLFYTRAVLDYILVYRLQEMLNPGYLRRMERRLETEQNQTHMLDPEDWSTLLGLDKLM